MTASTRPKLTIRRLLACGTAMPAIYVLTLIAASILNPCINPMQREPSVFGKAGSAFPFLYNAGLVVTALAGLLAAAGLISQRNAMALVIAGGAVGLGSAGLGMAGLFPLPNPLNYGFGLPLAAGLAPPFGAAALWALGRSSGGRDADRAVWTDRGPRRRTNTRRPARRPYSDGNRLSLLQGRSP